MIFQKLVTNPLFGWEFCVVQWDTFDRNQDYEKVAFDKRHGFISLVGPSETEKSQLIYNWLKSGTLQSYLKKIYFFHQHSRPYYDVMQKKIENFEIVQGVNFEIIDSLKN